jgi:hypothetical protein
MRLQEIMAVVAMLIDRRCFHRMEENTNVLFWNERLLVHVDNRRLQFFSHRCHYLFIFVFATSFIGQGVNVTTYAIAAEANASYRSSRGTFHGVSAFLGKLAALVVTIIFGYLTTEQMFWVCGGCAIAGGVCTYLFTVLDLSHVAITG